METGKVLPNTKGHQSAANEQPAGDRFGMMFSNLPGPTHHLRSDLGVGEVAIGLMLGKDVPKNDQQASGDGDDSLARDEALGKTIEFTFPIGIEIHGCPGGLDQSGSKVTAAGFRDPSLAEGLAGGMDTGAKTRVADQLLGRFKTGDVADSGKDGQPEVYTKARYLKGEGHGITPLGGIAEAGNFSIELSNLRFEVI